MLRKRVTLGLLLLALVACGGCMRAAGETLGVVTGAKGEYVQLEPLQGELIGYTAFQLEPFKDSFGGKTPFEVQQALPAQFAKQLAEKKVPNHPGGKTLIIRGEFLHYESASLVENVGTPLEEVIARVKLIDKGTGAVVGEANCVGRTTTTTGRGPEKKAEGLAKAIVAWIDKYFPKDAKEK